VMFLSILASPMPIIRTISYPPFVSLACFCPQNQSCRRTQSSSMLSYKNSLVKTSYDVPSGNFAFFLFSQAYLEKPPKRKQADNSADENTIKSAVACKTQYRASK